MLSKAGIGGSYEGIKRKGKVTSARGLGLVEKPVE
jgi:hypothetical protein